MFRTTMRRASFARTVRMFDTLGPLLSSGTSAAGCSSSSLVVTSLRLVRTRSEAKRAEEERRLKEERELEEVKRKLVEKERELAEAERKLVEEERHRAEAERELVEEVRKRLDEALKREAERKLIDERKEEHRLEAKRKIAEVERELEAKRKLEEERNLKSKELGDSDKFSCATMKTYPMNFSSDPTETGMPTATESTSNPSKQADAHCSVLEPIPIEKTPHAWRGKDDVGRDPYILQHPSLSMGSLAWMGIAEDKTAFNENLSNPYLKDSDKDALVSIFEVTNPFFHENHCTKDTRLFVRNRYYPYVWGYVRRKMLSGISRFVVCVVGQPGIGKSFGVGNYLAAAALSHAADMAARANGHGTIEAHAKLAVQATADLVLVVVEEMTTSVVYGGRQFQIATKQDVAVVDCVNGLGTSNSSVLILHDCKSGRTAFHLQKSIYQGIGARMWAQVGLVYLASPHVENFSVCIRKMDRGDYFPPTYIYLPVWSADEMATLADQSKTPAYVKNYPICGGVLCGALAPHGVIRDMEHAIKGFDIAEFLVGYNFDKCSSDLACIVPNDVFNDCLEGLAFRSDRAWEIVLKNMDQNMQAQMLKVLTKGASQAFKLYQLAQIFGAVLQAAVGCETFAKGTYRIPLVCEGIFARKVSASINLRKILADVGKTNFCTQSISVVKNDFGPISKAAIEFGQQVCNSKKTAVLVKMSLPNSPLIDFMLLVREPNESTWRAYAFQVTAAASHHATSAPHDAFERYFPLREGKHSQGSQISLAAFVYVGYSANGEVHGVNLEQPKKRKKDAAYYSKVQHKLTIVC